MAALLTTRKIQLSPSIERIRKWLESVVNNPPARRRLLTLASDELRDRAKVYPPEGLWNFEPGTGDRGIWYERGYGSRWRIKSTGRLGGRRTSQKLDRSWQTEIHTDAYNASVFTNVTYAPYLFDPFQRVAWAEAHGWQDIDEIANDYAPRFEKLTLEYIDDELEKPI